MHTQLYHQIFFTNVLRLLDEKGWTKEQLADISGVSISFISNLTNGKANPSLRIMEQLAAALDTPLPALLETTDLTEEVLDQLTDGKWTGREWCGLPSGFERVSVVLTSHHAYIARQWATIDRQLLAEKRTTKK